MHLHELELQLVWVIVTFRMLDHYPRLPNRRTITAFMNINNVHNLLEPYS